MIPSFQWFLMTRFEFISFLKSEGTYTLNIGITTRLCSNKLTLVWNCSTNLSRSPVNCGQNVVSKSWIFRFHQMFLWALSQKESLCFCYELFSSLTHVYHAFLLLFFIYDQHAFSLRLTCLLHMLAILLPYVLHVFASRPTPVFYLFKPVVRWLYSLAFH